MAQGDIATSKGTILKSLLRFIEKELTPEQRQRAYARLLPEERALTEGRVLPSTLVPEHALNRITEEAANEKGEDLFKFGIRAGHAELADSIGMYRFLLVVLTPNALLAKAPSFWGSVHNRGVLTAEDQTPHSARLRLSDYPSERAHCARLTGWFEGLSQKTGVKNLTINHTHCKATGDADCQWEVRWG